MEKTQRNPLALWLTVFFGLLLVWNIFLQFQTDKSTMANYFYAVGYSLFYIIIAIFGFAKLRKVGLQSAAAKALLFMSIGATIFAFAFWLYTYFILAYKVDIPYPSIADYFFLSFVPCVAIGFFFLLSIFKPFLTWRVIAETVIMVVVGVGILFHYAILPKFGADIPTLEKVFNIIYPTNDSILLALMIIALRVSGGKIKGYFLLFIITFALMITGDLLYSYRTSYDIQWNGDIVDLVFTFTAFSFSMAALTMIRSVVEPEATFSKAVPTPPLTEGQG